MWFGPKHFLRWKVYVKEIKKVVWKCEYRWRYSTLKTPESNRKGMFSGTAQLRIFMALFLHKKFCFLTYILHILLKCLWHGSLRVLTISEKFCSNLKYFNLINILWYLEGQAIAYVKQLNMYLYVNLDSLSFYFFLNIDWYSLSFSLKLTGEKICVLRFTEGSVKLYILRLFFYCKKANILG